MPNNRGFNSIILLKFVILVVNMQILQSIPAINPKELYHAKQKLYHTNIYANNIDDNYVHYFEDSPKTNQILERKELQKKYKRKINEVKNELLNEENLFDRDDQSYDKWWWAQDVNRNEILNNKFLNHVSHDFQLNDKYNTPYELKTKIYPREALLNHNKVQLENSSLYPSILTKAVEISLNPLNSQKPGDNLLANVAKKMNTSTLDLANKLAKTADVVESNGHLAEIVQGYMKHNDANVNNNVAFNRSPKQKLGSELNALQIDHRKTEANQNFADNENNHITADLSTILERILNKLDSIYDSNDEDDEEHPDGASCDVIGSWSSSIMGLCFDIQLHDDKIRNISPAEINNKILFINAKECTPAKRQTYLLDLQWKFKGSALKQWGGPFYIYGQKRSENLAATFLGFCRTCGGIDTIFGAWNIILPSKDCNDISLAFDIKRDVLRRNLMEIKRKQRFKNVLYQSRHG